MFRGYSDIVPEKWPVISGHYLESSIRQLAWTLVLRSLEVGDGRQEDRVYSGFAQRVLWTIVGETGSQGIALNSWVSYGRTP